MLLRKISSLIFLSLFFWFSGIGFAEDQASTAEKVEKTLQAVVHLETLVVKQRLIGSAGDENGSFRRIEETGSGVVVSIKGKSWILTNRHVVAGVRIDAVRAVIPDLRRLTIKNMLHNAEFDLGLLEIEENDVPVAPFGDSDQVKRMDTVFVLGSPFGLSQSVSRGIISGKNRSKIPQGDHAVPFYQLLQTDAAVNPGNSGGPIVNTQGEVIGIVTAIASSSGTNEGVGFAIPINEAIRYAEELIETGRIMRPSLGIELAPEFSDAEREQAGLIKQVGVKVLRVTPDSPADLVGIQADDVIVKYGETDVENDAHLVRLIAQSQVGEEPTVIFIRGKAPFEVKPKLAAVESR